MNKPEFNIEATATSFPSNLMDLARAAANIPIPPEELKALADAGYAPHWRINNGEPYFRVSELKQWMVQNCLYRCEGRPFDEFRLVVEGKPADSTDRPKQLAELENLRDLTDSIFLCSGIYFLCDGLEIVYVGQSTKPVIRIVHHLLNKKFNRIFLLPWSPFDLDRIEGALIRYLKPKYNGIGGPMPRNEDYTYMSPSDVEQIAKDLLGGVTQSDQGQVGS